MIFLLIYSITLTGLSQVNSDSVLIQTHFGSIPDIAEIQNDSSIINTNEVISDSVYIKRLSLLPFEFKMTYNPIVKRYIQLYTVKIKSKVEVMIGLSTFYFPIFEKVLRSNNLPDELKYIPIIESALNPKATSPVHAAGLWQFMKGTGKENGLTINSYVDQRRGCIESTNAAAKYLKMLYKSYHDWQLVLAAYDCGPGNVNRAIRRAHGKRDFWEIYPFLPRETRAYVPAYIGAAYAMNYYKEHDINPVPSMFPAQTDTIRIFQSLHLQQVSQVLGIDIDLLRRINPQYIKDMIPGTSLTDYALHIPGEQKENFIALQDSIYAYRKSYYKNEYHQRQYASGRNVPVNSVKIIHRVHAGESIGQIAAQYKVSVKKLKGWNKISGNNIKKGQKLVVYGLNL